MSQKQIRFPSDLTKMAEDNFVNGKSVHAFWIVFCISIVLCWLPIKPLAYITPWLSIFIILVLTRSRKILVRLLSVLGVWLALICVYAIVVPGFFWYSALLSLFTYGTFVFVMVVPIKFIASNDLLERAVRILCWITLLEAIWGIIQGLVAFSLYGTLDKSVGDSVAGTIRPFLGDVNDLSNQMFAINLSFSFIFLLFSYRNLTGMLLLLLVLGALIMSSVVHVLISLALSLIVILLLYNLSSIRTMVAILSAILVGTFLLFILAPSNLFSVSSHWYNTLNRGTPRSEVVYMLLWDGIKRYPWMVFVGAGPGQFSSRAGLIGTGMFFGGPADPRPIPFSPRGMSEIFERYVLDVWLRMSFYPQVNDTSTANRPFSSWLSICVEFGLTTFLFLSFALVRWLWTVRTISYRTLQFQRGMLISAAMLFLFLLGLFENYWEVPQAIFIGVLVVQIHYAVLLKNYEVSIRS